MKKPYVISAELDLANPDIVNPAAVDGFRESLDADLSSMDKDTLWVPTGSIQNGLQRILAKTSLPVASLDDRYVANADRYLGISRGLDEQLNDAGYAPRVGYQSIAEQLGQVPTLGREVVIADDVVFSGEMISWLADELKAQGVKIGGVVCGIAIREGAEKLALEGIDVEAVLTLDDVEDEICERDFAVVPGSGRRIADLSANALYFDNINGKPEQWASLPLGDTEMFCISSLERSIKLLQPAIPMQNVGNFVGYGQNGTAREQLLARIGEAR